MKSLLIVLLTTLGFSQSTQQAGRITRIEFRPATTQEGGGVFITLVGSGNCTYTLDYGDSQSERRTAELPDRVRHVYEGDGEYLVVATPEAPCEGVARARLDVRAIKRGVWGLSAEPGVATPEGIEVTFTINGAGECNVSMEFGDGAIERVQGPLPARYAHRYAKPGTYEVRAIANDPCRGEAALKLEVSR